MFYSTMEHPVSFLTLRRKTRIELNRVGQFNKITTSNTPPPPKKKQPEWRFKKCSLPNQKQLCMQLLRNNVFVLTRLPHSCRETAGGSPPAAAIRKAPSTTKRFTRMSTWWPLFGQSKGGVLTYEVTEWLYFGKIRRYNEIHQVEMSGHIEGNHLSTVRLGYLRLL